MLVSDVKTGLSGAKFDAFTKNGLAFLKKTLHINPIKLKQQYDWLNKFKHLEYIPDVEKFTISDLHSSYIMPFYMNFTKLSEFLLSDYDKSTTILIKILTSLENDIHAIKINTEGSFEKYLKVKCLDKLAQCENLLNDLESCNFIYCEKLTINGVEYNNLKKIIDMICSNNDFVRSIGQRDGCEIHGDLTAENILIQDEKFILIDCNQDNIISNLAVEVSKLFQSFHSGYEFFSSIDSLNVEDNNIQFRLNIPIQYRKCSDFLFEYIEKAFGVKKYEIIFHEAIHFSRIMPYMLIKNPKLFPVVYAHVVRLLNESIELYE